MKMKKEVKVMNVWDEACENRGGGGIRLSFILVLIILINLITI
jgi:hypothetical protein